MSAVLEWLKTFLMLYFFLTLILYLVPKKSYQKYLQFAVKMILLVVVFLIDEEIPLEYETTRNGEGVEEHD